MIAPLDFESAAVGGLLLDRWNDIAVRDLPTKVQEVALRDPESWTVICEALVAPAVVTDACDAFVDGIRRRLRHRYRDARIAAVSLAREGLLSDDIPTLESLGNPLNIGKERVRQLIRDIRTEAKAELKEDEPLCFVIGAEFALHPGTPLTIDRLAQPETARGRAVNLAIETIGLPKASVPFLVWTETQRQRRGLEAVVTSLPQLLPRSTSLRGLERLLAGELPHIEDALNLPATLALVADRLDFGPLLNGQFGLGYAQLHQRVAGKIVTYLQRRAVPIEPAELARFFHKGVPPFEAFHRPLVESDWLTECARLNPTLLQLHPDGRIALARGLEHPSPTGNVGILHSILVDHGEPMRMIDLCDSASRFGITRNSVGVLIHGGRAACIFMLDRGIVGLVGRDEGADTSQYEAAHGTGTRVQVGEEIGFDGEGHIAADVDIRRSIKEQGFSPPWPFSIIYFADHPELQVDGHHREMIVRNNGALDLPELEPGSRTRLRLAVTPRGHLLSIERVATDPVTAVRDLWDGSPVPIGLLSAGDQPGWIDFILAAVGPKVKSPGDFLRSMPRAMASKRRLRALFGLAALGFLQPCESGWICSREGRLPAELARAFATARDDASRYPVLPRQMQAATAWLVRATWLVPSLGWSSVRPNDLADIGVDDGQADIAPVATSPRETALMRIVEAAHHAHDLGRHPGADAAIELTRTVVRRYLTALGFTSYNALRPLDRSPESPAIAVHRADGTPAAIWMLLPLGGGISDDDVLRARQVARDEGVATAVATDGLSMVALENGRALSLDLRTVGQSPTNFDRLMSLAGHPPFGRE
jgi:hypothetical protein